MAFVYLSPNQSSILANAARDEVPHNCTSHPRLWSYFEAYNQWGDFQSLVKTFASLFRTAQCLTLCMVSRCFAVNSVDIVIAQIQKTSNIQSQLTRFSHFDNILFCCRGLAILTKTHKITLKQLVIQTKHKCAIYLQKPCVHFLYYT